MSPRSQELYVLELLNLPIADAKKKLWADGWLVGIRKMDGQLTYPVYQDEKCNPFHGKDKAGRRLAALEIEGNHIKGIVFFDTNTTTGEAVPIPLDRPFIT